MAKYLRQASECLASVTAGKRGKLDPSVRRGMIGELRAQGIEVYKERADSYVAQRYDDRFRTDVWSDEARAAALEARRANAASSKAEAKGTALEHFRAKQAHEKAAIAYREAAETANRVARNTAASAAPGRTGDPIDKKLSALHAEAQSHEASANTHAAKAEAHAAEQTKINAAGMNVGFRSGFSGQTEKVNPYASAKPGTPVEAHGMTAKVGASGKLIGKTTTPEREAALKVKASTLGEKARAASVKAKAENSVSAHGEASVAHNAAAKAATKAGATGQAAEHKKAAAEHLAAMHNVSNANTQLANRAHEGSPLGRAEAEAKAKSAAANAATKRAEPSGPMTGPRAPHAAAAQAHREASAAHVKAEQLARAMGNEFKASAHSSYASQHSVKASEHAYAAGTGK